MANLHKPYRRELVLETLRRHNVRVEVVQTPVGMIPSSVLLERDQYPGIKLWAYIESLGIPWFRRG
jgi:hypothetical protein